MITIFFEKKKEKKTDFFSCDNDIFDGSNGCAIKFHVDNL